MNRVVVAALVVGIVLSQYNCASGCGCVGNSLTSGSGFNSIGNLGVGGLGGLSGLGGNSLTTIGVGNTLGGGITTGLDNNFGGINNGLVGIGSEIGSGLSTGLTGLNSLGGINRGLSTNINNLNVGLGGLNTGLNSGFGGLTTNIGSLDLIGTGVGFNTAGLGGIGSSTLNTPAVLTTPSLTGNVFSSSITNTPSII
jgi:hypothetical protein